MDSFSSTDLFANGHLYQHWLTSNTLIGAVHFVTASLGLLLGLGILFLHPGSTLHKRIGYVFVPTVVIVNLSALFIHQMGARFGPFHIIIPFSLWALYQGMKPFYQRPRPEYAARIHQHIRGMIAAALGLWAAFTAEFTVRTPAIGRLLDSVHADRFWVLTIEGFAIAFWFIYLIRVVSNYQFKRLGTGVPGSPKSLIPEI